MMTLEEAIKHCKDVALSCTNKECALEHFQLLKWLQEYSNMLEKQGEQNPADKVEPKFKVGDWVVNKFGDSWHIDSFDKKNYQVSDGKGNYNYFPISKQDEMHLWNITDAKPGDVLVGRGVILMFKGIGNTEWNDVIDYHCYYDYHRKDFVVQKDLEYWGNTDNNQLKPATKEQRDLLLQKMHEAGYEWSNKDKTLTWSNNLEYLNH